MTRILSSTLLTASLLLACSSGTTGTTSGTTSGTVAGTGTGSTSSGTGTTSSSGSTSGATSGSHGTTSSSGETPFCNGVELQSSASTNLYVGTFPESDEIGIGCDSAFDALSDGGANATYTAMGGILDNNNYSTQAGLLTLYPAGCDDLGQDAGPNITATTITPPAGASTVAAARAGQLDGGTVYGIVTYVSAPYFTTKAHSGTLYLQDAPSPSGPAPMSGISIFIDKDFNSDAGTVGYPSTGLARGDVVSITGLEWSPFGTTDVQDQLSYTAGSVVTVLGTQPLPTAVPLSATDIASGSQQYAGMRVSQTDVPDSVTNACPTLLQSN